MSVSGKMLLLTAAPVAMLAVLVIMALANASGFAIAVAGILLLIASIGCGLAFYASVVRPVEAFTAAVATIAEGKPDVRRRLPEVYGPFAEPTRALNSLLEAMADAMATLTQVADQVAAASSQLADSARGITGSAEKQAMQALEVATAMEQMTATVAEVARNATRVADQARTGTDLAGSGAGVVRQTIESMETIAGSVHTSAATVEELGRRSAEIGQIIGVISDIADLTNLLSLNAAIEAARAGEHGRGFAVVADEVRKLAEKTSHATNEVRETIGATLKETEDAVTSMRSGTSVVKVGVEHASRAERSLADIVSSYATVNDMVHQIATAAEEQSRTASEIARHIDLIANGSRDVTTSIGDIASASQALAELAERMRNQLGRLGARR